MKKDNECQQIYKVNDYYFRWHNIGYTINEQIDFIYYQNQDIWYVYGEDFNGKKIDIVRLTNSEIQHIISWDKPTKERLIKYILDEKNIFNRQSIDYKKDIVGYFYPSYLREQKLKDLLI